MRLFEAIVDANHRAVEGDAHAGLHPAEFEQELPIVALTCIDARLNSILPQALGVPTEQFIWLRNAGNIITGPVSSTMRSLALACALKGAKEIAIIGHTDCLVGKTTTMQLLDLLRAVGIERHLLPENINEYFGLFGSERQNVIKAAGLVRNSPLIGPKIPVHGLLIETDTGKVEWLVNGYESLSTVTSKFQQVLQSADQTVDALKSLTDFQIGGLKFPETKIGEAVTNAEGWVSQKLRELEAKMPEPSPAPAPEAKLLPPGPPKIPIPPPIRARMRPRIPRK